MGKSQNSVLFGVVVALLASLPLRAQQKNAAPAEPISSVASAANGQAPDNVTNKITELVHAGKYSEAQQLTTGLLVAYPADQRLIKAKALLDKLLAPGGSRTAAPSGNQPENSSVLQSAVNTNADSLTGMEKVDYNSLLELARQAQLTSDLSEQKALLQQFMKRSEVFLQRHPGQMLLWQLRAASAISLDDPMAGYEAGQTLLGAGAADSDDPNLQRLLGQLKNKGWLDKQGAEEAKKHVEELKNKPKEISVTYTGEASGSGNARGRDASSNIPFNLQSKLDGDVASLLQVRFPGTNIRINTPSPDEPALKMTINVHDTAWTYHCGLFSCDVSVTSQLMVSVSSPTELRVERTFALEIKRNVSKGGSGFSERLFASSLPNWIGEEVMARFRGVLDEDAVRTSLNNPTRNP